jgi:large subunit ribosomal protein L30|tara:strand:+ start:2167 stop:2343 length:177 start_codon:yes stop_codon:yes gene_type:complete
MAKIKIKKIKSEINRPSNQKLTLLALGLRKIGQIVEHEDTPSIVGMVEKVKHLVQIVK